MAGAITEVTDDTFDAEVLQSETPVLVDFWAEWCPPCRLVSPIIESLAEEYGDRLKVVQAKTDDCMQACQQYGIMNIPTIILFKNGEIAEQMVGARSKEDFKAAIDAKL